MAPLSRPRVTAVLGPTNTGKTYLAIERMLGHGSGMIGFPLRLLARENYDRVCRLKGPGAAALITGEERIVPPHPRYFLCTVEAMPLVAHATRPVDFLAIDEIQLCADRDRGHVFTDRLLHARGAEETMFLGAATAAGLVRRLVPDADFVSRPRLSSLAYAGAKKVTRLPPRSAAVAFSAGDVYVLAELIRRQRGGTAVVLGALSPRTRNAQVAMYEAGEVDYLVATDAIGMGLNMAIDHVAFSALAKFDGHIRRRLSAAEVGQIAGRAGRHMNDGTFGVTAEQPPMDEELVSLVEEHRFEPLRYAYWPNRGLEFRSLGALRRSLDARPPDPMLRRAPEADDAHALAHMMADTDLAAMATTPDAVRLMWEVCRIPDYRKDVRESHVRLIARIFRFLAAGPGVIPDDWINRLLTRLDRTDGDIDTLVARIAHTRTWAYVSHRGDWLDDAAGWQERARALEDKLSDALHQGLTQRFVDRRTAVLVKRLRERGDDLLAAVTDAGEVLVEGEFVGHVEGFRFRPDSHGAAAALTAANRVLRGEIERRVVALVAAPDDAIALTPDATLAWDGAPVARLAAGRAPTTPLVEVLTSDFLDAPQRERLRRRLTRWLTAHLAATVAPLMALTGVAEGDATTGPVRGMAFRPVERSGAVARAEAEALLADLSKDDRRALARLGVRLGVETVYLPALLKPAAARLTALLWAVQAGRPLPALPDGSRTSALVDAAVPADAYRAAGYVPAGPLAVRADVLERLLLAARRQGRAGAFVTPPEMLNLVGATAEDFAGLMRALGWRAEVGEAGVRLTAKKRPAAKGRKQRRATPPDADSPFAKLRDLVPAK